METRTFALSVMLLCLLARPAWAASEIIANFVDMPVKTASGAPPSPGEVHDAIVNAASSVPVRPWSVTDSGPGRLIARLQTGRRGHQVMVEITYSPLLYSVSYRNSVHMNYRASDQTIHTSYNVWVKELVDHIDRALGVLTPVAGAAPVAPPAAVPLAAAPAAASAPPTPGLPQAGDTWTYRATYIRRRGEAPVNPAIRTHVVRIESASEAEIVDQLTIDGGQAISTKHVKGAYLVPQGLSIFSPYVGLFLDISQPASLGGVDILGGCQNYACEADARIVGSENIRVAAGTFTTTRIVVKQSWAPAGMFAGALGGRTLTLWYSPQAKRVVKYSSRVTVGAYAPIDPHFDLELVSYQLK
jgi:hypothetical protein